MPSVVHPHRVALSIGIAVAVLLGAALAAPANDWAAWRGPTGDGVSTEKGVITGTPSVQWTAELGAGYSPATVVGDKVYCAGWAGGQDTVYCLNAADGSEVWTQSYSAQQFKKNHEGGPVGQVVVDNGKAYLIDRVGTLRCWSAADGKPQWEANLAQQLGVKPPTWMFSGSPVIDGRTMYVDLGVIAAINLANGRVTWKTQDFGPAYSTPQPFKYNGRSLLAVFPKSGLVIIDTRSGRALAQHKWDTSYGVNAATPLVIGDKVFISSGYNTGCALLQFTGSNLKLLWQNKNMRNQMASCVAIGDYIYGIDENQLACLSIADGSQKWAERSIGKGALSAGDGKLIVQADRGDLVIADADPAGHKQVARLSVLGGRNQWAMPILANGKVYCRSITGKLACVKFD